MANFIPNIAINLVMLCCDALTIYWRFNKPARQLTDANARQFHKQKHHS